MSLRYNSDSEGFTGLEAALILIAFIAVASIFAFEVLGAGFFTSQKSQEIVYKSVGQASTNVQVVGNVYGIQSTGSNGIDEIYFNIALTPGSPPVDLDTMKIVFSTPATMPVTLSRGTSASRSTFVVRDVGGNSIDTVSPAMGLTLLLITGRLVSPSSLSSTTTTGKLVTGSSPTSPTVTTGKPVTSSTSVSPTVTTGKPVTTSSPVTTTVSQTVTVTNTEVSGVSFLHENQQVEIVFNAEPVQPYTKMTVEIRPGTGAPVVFSRTAPATLDRTNILLH